MSTQHMDLPDMSPSAARAAGETGDGLAVDRGFLRAKRVGWGLVALVFGGFGLWACTAPIEGAARAPGSVTVESYKKVIQHLEGGIVRAIHVRDGDSIQAGEVLLELDDTQSLTRLQMARSRLFALAAREARLLAERDGLEQVLYPDPLRGEPQAQEEMLSQQQVFVARRDYHRGRLQVLDQQINQLQSRLEGLRSLRESRQVLLSSYEGEQKDYERLTASGFSEKAKLRELERNRATLQGELAELSASITSTEMEIEETRLQRQQEDNQFRHDIVSELDATRSELKEVRESVVALTDVVERSRVRAPEAGIVNGMQVHTVGGVINPGTVIAEIVPEADELIIEARVSVLDIDRVVEGQRATIRFSSFSSQQVPSVEGRLFNLSADSFVDQNTGYPYYNARVEVTKEGLEALDQLVLMPGMAAEVYISTGSRTLFQYLSKPISNALARSLIED